MQIRRQRRRRRQQTTSLVDLLDEMPTAEATALHPVAGPENPRSGVMHDGLFVRCDPLHWPQEQGQRFGVWIAVLEPRSVPTQPNEQVCGNGLYLEELVHVANTLVLSPFQQASADLVQ